MLTDHNDIAAWLKLHHISIGKCNINDTGTVDAKGDVWFRYTGGDTLPIQFGRIEGSFNVNESSLTSFVGFPHYIEDVLYCSRTNITSLHGIETAVNYVGDSFFCTGRKPTHMLGLLLIRGIDRVYIGEPGNKSDYTLQRILEKYVGGSGDILTCQDELIDAGYIDQARL
jgi:hypothetical protein